MKTLRDYINLIEANQQGVADHKAWENEHNNKEQDVAEGDK